MTFQSSLTLLVWPGPLRDEDMTVFLTIVGSIAAAVFGILALLTDFRGPNRSISPRARFVILGIAASTFLTVISNYLSQIQSSIETTDRHSALMTSIWHANSRIDTGDISVVVQYSFHYPLAGEPEFLATGWDFELVANDDSHVDSSLDRFSWSLKPVLKEPQLHLNANVQEITYRSRPTVDYTSWTQTSVFTRFTGELGPFTDPNSWNGANFEAVITATGNDSYRTQEETFNGRGTDPKIRAYRNGKWTRLSFTEYYSVPSTWKEDYDAGIGPLPIEAELTIYVQDRPVTSAIGWPARVWEHDEDVRRLKVIKFPIVKVPPTKFEDPTAVLKSDGSSSQSVTFTLKLVGWILVLASIVAGIGLYRSRSTA